MEHNPIYEELVTAHSREIHAYLWRLLADPLDAEDGLQETFLRALRAYPRLAAGSNCRAWLYKIATNVARTQLKRRSALARRTADFEPALEPAQPAGGAGTAAAAEAQGQLAALRQAVERLPERQRSALLLRKYQELSYTEIAAALDCSQAAARANVYQALQRLRRELAQEETEVKYE